MKMGAMFRKQSLERGNEFQNDFVDVENEKGVVAALEVLDHRASSRFRHEASPGWTFPPIRWPARATRSGGCPELSQKAMRVGS